MKRIVLYFLAACFTACCFSAQAEHVTKIIGLVNMADWKVAWLEMTDSPLNKVTTMTSRQFVEEGQSFDDKQIKGAHVHIEILQIDFTNGIVKAKEDGKDAVYEFKRNVKTGEISPQITLRLDNSGLGGFLDMYAATIGRTLLIHPEIHQMDISVLLQAQDKAEAATALEKILREKGIAVIPDGRKFEMIVPVGREKTIRSNLEDSSSAKPDTETPGYSLNFSKVDLGQTLKTYEGMVGKKMKPSDVPLPAMSFTFQTFSPLTKVEVLHAFDTLFAWQGIKAVNVDEKSFKMVSIGKP